MSKSAEVLKDPGFLRKAREQLDADHYGLDKIKRRLIEYLAIARLRQLAFEEEMKVASTVADQSGDRDADAVKSSSTSAAQSPMAQKDPKSVIPAAPFSVNPIAKKQRASAKGPILL